MDVLSAVAAREEAAAAAAAADAMNVIAGAALPASTAESGRDTSGARVGKGCVGADGISEMDEEEAAAPSSSSSAGVAAPAGHTAAGGMTEAAREHHAQLVSRQEDIKNGAHFVSACLLVTCFVASILCATNLVRVGRRSQRRMLGGCSLSN